MYYYALSTAAAFATPFDAFTWALFQNKRLDRRKRKVELFEQLGTVLAGS